MWRHKRLAHRHDLAILSYSEEYERRFPDSRCTNKQMREWHEKWRDYHQNELRELKSK